MWSYVANNNVKSKYGYRSECKISARKYDKEYYQRPEVKEHRKQYQRRPEIKEYKKQDKVKSLDLNVSYQNKKEEINNVKAKGYNHMK